MPSTNWIVYSLLAKVSFFLKLGSAAGSTKHFEILGHHIGKEK